MIQKSINNISILSALLLSAIILTACSDKDGAGKLVAKKVEGKWYTDVQLVQGKKVFKSNCAVCHGENGQGLVADWKKPNADGTFPAPPLNGTAHAWHHSKSLLMRTVNEGGVALGGTMPSFKGTLTNEEKDAVLAHVMSLWPKKTYDIWQKRNPATK
jgi:mono/diheme cytochrome c family protein